MLSRPWLTSILALAFLAAGCPGLPPAEPAAVTAFTNVTVLPLTRDGNEGHPNWTVMVAGELIIAAGPEEEVAIPPRARIIDGQNRFLMPGLTDMHVHVATETSEEAAPGQLLLFLANGVTTILNAGDFFEPVPEYAARTRGGEWPGPTIYCAEYARAPRDGNPTNVHVTSPQQAREYVRQAKANGYQFIKVYNWTGAEEFAAIIGEARLQELAVIGHIPFPVGFRDTLEAGQVGVAHLGAGGYFSSIFGDRVRPERIPEAIELTNANGVWVTTTLAVDEVLTRVWGRNLEGEQHYFNQRGVEYAHPGTLHRWRLKTEIQQLFSRNDAQPGDRDEAFAFMLRYTGAFHAGGVKFLLGSDAPTVLLMAGFSVHRELELLAEAGLSAPDILVIATRNAGEFIAQHAPGGPPFGQVAPGRRADLILLEADPRADVAHLRQLAGVMARGRWYSQADLEGRLAALAAERITQRTAAAEDEENE